MPRSSGARIAEANNVPEAQVGRHFLVYVVMLLNIAQIRRGRRWNSDQMTGCYLTDLPQQFMRGMADFEPDYASNYFIPRDTVKPPSSLRRRVWPQLDRWRQAHLDLPGAVDIVEPNLAAGGFLELLDKLRDVFLQDSVFLQQEFPNHPIFRDALFGTAEYAIFAAAVLAAADTLQHEDPHLVAIAKAIPSVNERLRSLTSVIQTGQASHATALAQMTSSINELATKLDDFLTGSFSLTFTPGRSRMLPQGYDSMGQPQQHLTSPSLLNLDLQQPVDLGGPPPPPTRPTAQQEAAVLLYKLSRQVVTIPDLWKEWTVGLGGLPSVAALDKAYGSRWRSPSERQYYSMRKVIIDEILAIAGGKADDRDEVASAIEALERQRVQNKFSLDKFIKTIKGQRKQRQKQ